MKATFPMSKYSMVELMATKDWRVKNAVRKDGSEIQNKPVISTCQKCMSRLREEGKIVILARRGAQNQLTFGKVSEDKTSFLIAKTGHVCGDVVKKTLPLKGVSVPLPPGMPTETPPTPQAPPVVPPEQYRFCKCGGELPIGREVFCYNCRPSRVKVPS